MRGLRVADNSLMGLKVVDIQTIIQAGRYAWIFFLGLGSVVTTMKRDLDLARKILLTLEENEEATGHGFVRLHVKGYPLEQVSYHVKLLDSAGLIEAIDISTLNICQ